MRSLLFKTKQLLFAIVAVALGASLAIAQDGPQLASPSVPRLVAPIVGGEEPAEIGTGAEEAAAVEDDSPSIPLPPAAVKPAVKVKTVGSATSDEATTVKQSIGEKPAEPAEEPPTIQDPEQPQLTPAAQKVLAAYEKATTAETLQELSEIIELCADARKENLSDKLQTYASDLSSWALNRRGELLLDQDQEGRAIADFNEAVAEKADNWRATHNLAVSHAQAGRQAEAIEGFGRTIKLNPKHVNAYFNRGELRYEAGEFQAAIDDYNEALKLTPKDAVIRNSRGHAYHQLGEYRRAVIDFTLAIKFDDKNAEAMTNRGDVYMELGHYKYAIHDFLQAVDTDPQLARAYQSAAWLMATCPVDEFRDAEGAVEAAITAIKLGGGQDSRDYDTLAAALANAGRFDQAQKASNKALQLAPAGTEQAFAARLALYTQSQPFRATPRPIEIDPALSGGPAEIEQSSFQEPPNPDLFEE